MRWLPLIVGATVLATLVVGYRTVRRNRAFARQKLTMARILDASLCMEAYFVRHGSYPTVDPTLVIPRFRAVSEPSTGHLSRALLAQSLTYPASGWPLKQTMQLARLRSPLEACMKRSTPFHLETDDDWGNPLLVGIAADGRSFVIASPGSNGQLEAGVREEPYAVAESWRDIVLADTVFVSSPAGI